MRAASAGRRLARRRLPALVRRALRRATPDAAEKRERAPRRRTGRPSQGPSLVRSLERGVPLDRAVLAQVRALVADGRHDRATSVAESLRQRADTAALGRLCAGVVAYRRGFRELAWSELAGLEPRVWAALAPAEYVRSGLSVAPADALADVDALVAADPAGVGARSWFEIVTAVWGSGAAGLARRAFAIFERRVADDPRAWRDGPMHRDWLAPWVAAEPDSPTAPPPENGRRTFAILDYGHPSASKASANLGDHVQSIASLGHLVRHERVRLHGRPELVALLEQLRARTRADRRRCDVEGEVEVVTVHRDASTYQPVPEDTWTLAFGWFMHPLFRMRHGFPLHRNLRPIFISFHCNKRELLTSEAVEYLRRHGPVGCRDWTTVHLLLSLDVPAFFSGCLTTTIDTVFPPEAVTAGPSASVAYVDVPAEALPPGAITYKHSRPSVRTRSFTVNVGTALELLDTYRSRHRAVVTSRLHCYLPVRSIGVDVEFRPANRSDIRFDGLIGIGDAEFARIRDGLLEKLERVLGAILSGRPEAEVYALWREITARDVEAARARRSAPEAALPAPAQRAAARARSAASRSARATPEDVLSCAVILARGQERALPVLAASILEHASRPIHLWVLAPAGVRQIGPRLAREVPDLRYAWVATRGLARGLADPAGARVAGAAVLRLLLADMLPGVARAVLLPLPSVVTRDVAELAALDLGKHAFAAPRRPGTAAASGFGVIHAAAARLGDRHETAAELRRIAHARHAFDFDAFATDVMVLDLDRMRDQELSARGLAAVQAYGLDDSEALHLLAGPNRATVPDAWAFVPTRLPAPAAPGLVHWADGVGPWQRPLTPGRELWRRQAGALKGRAAAQV